eukprot:evm.model.scf_139.9 EVM.evm.TU.scf_139.9   scf_139:103606-105667(-)
MDVDSDPEPEVYTPPASPGVQPRISAADPSEGRGGAGWGDGRWDGDEEQEHVAALEEFHNELQKAMLYRDVATVDRVWEQMKSSNVAPIGATLELMMRTYSRGAGDPYNAKELMTEVAEWGGFDPSVLARQHLDLVCQRAEQLAGL